LEKAAKMYPAMLNANSQFDVIRDIVGRRPARKGGFRLAGEPLVFETGDGPRTVRLVHAYGAGGGGYELSWGVAKEVVKLAFEEAPLRASI
jgi:D-amino-acid oxidase